MSYFTLRITIDVGDESAAEDVALAVSEYAEGIITGVLPANEDEARDAAYFFEIEKKENTMTALEYYISNTGIPSALERERLIARRALTLAEINACEATGDGTYTKAI